MSVKKYLEIFRRLFHIHRYVTLVIYPPHNQRCSKAQCKESNTYGFLLRCDCGYYKLTKLPDTITTIFEVKPE